jgi:hypothetical protein
MYACIPEDGGGFFEVACTLRYTTANFHDPPPPRNTKTGALAMGLRSEEDHEPPYRGGRFGLG